MKDKEEGIDGNWYWFNEPELSKDVYEYKETNERLDGYELIGEFIKEEYAIRSARCVSACNGIPLTALSSGVVGEMVEVFELFKEFYDAEVGIEWDVFWPKIQSILSKLEADNGIKS